MKQLTAKTKKVIAAAVGVALLVTALPFSIGAVNSGRELKNISAGDRKTAGDISNMTGVKLDTILKLRNEGKDWNQILTTLKYKDKGDVNREKDKRDSLLAGSGMKHDYLDKLSNEGYSKDEITDAKLVVERVVFQLQEITREDIGTVTRPKVDTGMDADKDNEKKVYSDLAGEFDSDLAVYLGVKLKKEFGNVEGVINEYLLALQLGIGFELYLVDKEEYSKQKDEKSAGFDMQKVITIEKIEEKLLKKVQNDNSKPMADPVINAGTGTTVTKPESGLPDVPKAGVEDIMPKNPAEQVMEEIDALNPLN